MSPATRGMAVGSVINDLLAGDRADNRPGDGSHEYRARLRWFNVLMLLLAVVIIGGAVLTAAMLVITSRSAGTATPPGAAEAGAGAPAAPADDRPGEPAAADCTVSPGTVTAETVITETSADEHRTNVRGETTITNTGDSPVYVAWRESHSTGHDNSGTELTDEGWYGGPFLLQPGESRTELVGAQTFDSGEQTWTLITDLATFPEAPTCADPVFAGKEAALAKLAAPVPNPFPAGPGS